MDYDCLIIDDEKFLADNTCEYFNMFEVKTKAVYGKEEALAFLNDNNASLILLDINLGDGSGFELCKILREDRDIPILFVSARNTDDDKIIALNIGGDDYITKPYSLNVLFAKVKAVLKRYERSTPSEGKALSFGDIGIDLDAGIVTKKGSEIELTAMEYKLLAYLVENKNKVVPKQDIFDKVWDDSFVTDGTLNVHVRHLREKLEEDPNEPTFIKTARGRGYIFKAE